MLITKSDISQYRQISQSVPDDIINQAIQDAELLDLKPLLGELLYYDLITNKAIAKYVDLLNGKTYVYNDNNYTTLGLKVVIANLAYARYIIFSGEKDTPFGLVNKNSQYSVSSEFTKKKAMAKQAEQISYEYFKSVKDFLTRKPDDYPLWESGTTERKFMFNKITK